MLTLKQLIRNVENLDIDKVAIAAINKTKDRIASLNVEQMMEGLRADGSEIEPGYSLLTIKIKQRKGQIFDHVTLRDTGAFQEGIFTKVQGLEIITTSTDSKTDRLDKKYSRSRQSIFGLNNKKRPVYNKEDLQPAFKEEIAKELGLKIH